MKPVGKLHEISCAQRTFLKSAIKLNVTYSDTSKQFVKRSYRKYTGMNRPQDELTAD